jgi:hypothetical protein
MHTQIRLHIAKRDLFAAGMSFGNVGPYEYLTGRIWFAVDPEAPAYRNVVDLEHAPRNPAGQVEYAAEVHVLKPVDLARSNRRLLYDVVNRGNKRALQFFNDAVHSNTPCSAEHAGNGFLMRRGYTLVWSAWQGDLLPGDGRMTMEIPTATAPSGEITGSVRAEFIADEPGTVSLPLSGNTYTRSYASVTLDTSAATFTYREHEGDARRPLPPEAWQFARLDDTGQPLPSPTDCYIPEGFRPGWIYELIYTARDPLVLGLGFTGVRDLVSFLRYAESDTNGTPNPLRQQDVSMKQAYAWGRSQSGRFLREFVYRGWNQDADGRRVFDGIMPHVAGGGRVTLNYRFAQPGRYPRQHEEHLYPSDQFPFAYVPSTDPLTGQTDAILKRPETDPLVLHTQTSTEYWQRRGSLVHTDAFGLDLPEHPRVRIYLFASSQHFAEPQGLPQHGPHRYLSNPLDTAPLLRALLDALEQWATHGTPPPPSRIPRRSDGTLIPASAVQAHFPLLPRVECPATPNRLHLQDYGPDFPRGLIAYEPPAVDTSHEYAVLVPLIDADGNDVPGIRTPHVEVPLATFTGWNLRPTGGGAKALASVTGSYFPFAQTPAQRQASGDPRPSLTERYRSRADYVARIARAAQTLVEARLLLEEDADRYVQLAMQEKAFN